MNTEDRAQSYANAFLEATMERWGATLRAVDEKLAADPGLQERVQTPDVDFAQRQPLLDKLLPADVDLPVRNLLYTLAQRGDLALLADSASALQQRKSQAEAALVPVEVVSAAP